MTVVLIVQVATFLALSVLFFREGDWRLGLSQLLLAAVQGVIYSGRMA